MTKSKSKKLPKFESLDKLVEFLDTHDTSEYWDQMPEVHFDIDIKKRTHLVALDENLANEVTEVARSKKTSSEALINSWIKEKLSKAS
jgi:CopG antitoxin of type II toxin-antitoxin system